MRITALFLTLAIILIAPPRRAAAQAAADPEHVSALTKAGMKVFKQRTWWCSIATGWKIEAGQTRMTQDLWKQLLSLPDIVGIYIGGQGIRDAELQRLCQIKTLEVLGLDEAPITDAGFAALNELKSLRTLMVGHTYTFNGVGVRCLKQINSLTHLEMGGSGVDDKGVAAICEMSQIKELVLRHDRYTRASLPLLAKMTNLEALEINPQWNAQNVIISDLSALAPLQHLKDLNIGNMVLPWENGLSVLKSLKELKTLRLYGNYISPDDLARAKAELPGVTFDAQSIDFTSPQGKALRDSALMQYSQAIAELKQKGLFPPK
jgi:hypothetical protein